MKGTAQCDARCLYKLPVGWHWKHRRGVTLIGDAAHSMAPVAGEGVNVALFAHVKYGAPWALHPIA